MEAREAAERETYAEAERDVTRHELVMARLDIDAAGSARAQMESKLARVQRALATLKKSPAEDGVGVGCGSIGFGCFRRGLSNGGGGSWSSDR